jgi:DNA invertase Pin-like site-specific DNA recombinase
MATTAELIPVVSYARISSDDEGDEHGVSDQHIVNRRTAKRLGWKIVHEFTDNDRSASKAGVVREDFETMLRVLHAGRLADGSPVRGVIVLADDRLARRAADYERFVEVLTYEDGRVFADARGTKDLYSEDVEGMGLVGVAFSKIEARKMRRRMRRWHRARAETGKPSGGTRPFGWADNRSSLEPSEAALLSEAAKDFIAGRSINSIVREWQSVDVRTSTGRLWTARSLKLALSNPRMCGWRRIDGEIIRDESGQPVVGQWEPIIAPEQWMAIDAIMEGRKGRRVGTDGRPGNDLPVDHREHKYLLTGILRCGKPRPDGTPCNARLRVTQQRDCLQHIYACPPRSGGGCNGIGRRGDKVDEYVTEAVLAKLEERRAIRRTPMPWPKEAELARIESKLTKLRVQWQQDQISDELFFATARELEEQQRALRGERNRHELSTQRVDVDLDDVRSRWVLPPGDGGLDMSQKRAYVREALHAVIVLPVGPGKGGRSKFDPDLLVPVWRED